MDLDYGMSTNQGESPNFYDLLHHTAVTEGQKALQSGKIDPAEAAKNAKKLGIGDPNELDAIIAKKPGHFDYSFSDPNRAPVPGRKPQQKITNTHAKPMDQQGLATAMDTVRNTPEFQTAQQGLEQNSDVLPQLMMHQASSAWIQPLAALADYVSSQSGNRGTASEGVKNISSATPAQQAQMLLKYQEDQQKRKDDLAKLLISSSSTLNKNRDKEVIVTGDMTGGMNTPRARAERFHNEVLRKLDNNPNLSKQLQSANAMENALDMLSGKNGIDVNPQLFHEGMQAIRLNLAGAGRSGVGERSANYMDSLEKEWDNILQKWGNKVESIPPNDPQLVQLKRELEHARGMMKTQRGRLMNSITSGNEYLYDNPDNADLKMSLENKIKSFEGITPDREDIAPPPVAKAKIVAPVAGGTAKKPVQEMSLEELKAELNGQ